MSIEVCVLVLISLAKFLKGVLRACLIAIVQSCFGLVNRFDVFYICTYIKICSMCGLIRVYIYIYICIRLLDRPQGQRPLHPFSRAGATRAMIGLWCPVIPGFASERDEACQQDGSMDPNRWIPSGKGIAGSPKQFCTGVSFLVLKEHQRKNRQHENHRPLQKDTRMGKWVAHEAIKLLKA